MAWFMVAVTKVLATEIVPGMTEEKIGDIVKSWKYNDYEDAERQYRKVVKGLELHGKKMLYNIPNAMALTDTENGHRLWITLTEEA